MWMVRACVVVGTALLTASAVHAAPDVAHVVAYAPGDEEPSPVATATYAVGARFAIPGHQCALGPGAPAAEVIATSAGAFTLRCSAEGQPPTEVPVVIAPVIVAAAIAPVRRGTRTKVHVSVASVAPIGDHLQIEAIGDLDLADAERVDGGLDIELTAPATAHDVGLLVRAGSVELGRVAIDLVDPPPPPPYLTESAWFALDLGARIGGFVPPAEGSGANLFGHPSDPNDRIASGPLAGIHLGVFPTRRVGLELEQALATPSYVGRFGVAALSISRAQLAFRMIEDGRYGLRLVGGVDLISVLSEAGTSHRDSILGVHYGAAFAIETRPGVSVRFDVLHVITNGLDAGYAHTLEMSVGVVTRLGRRDRWR